MKWKYFFPSVSKQYFQTRCRKRIAILARYLFYLLAILIYYISIIILFMKIISSKSESQVTSKPREPKVV